MSDDSRVDMAWVQLQSNRVRALISRRFLVVCGVQRREWIDDHGPARGWTEWRTIGVAELSTEELRELAEAKLRLEADGGLP